MTETAEKLFRQALALTPNERVGLVEELLNSLDMSDPVLDAQWAEESLERLRALRAVEIESYSSEDVFAALSRA
ncbi:MAG: putative addiction module component (TIGR02574 family) [Gammaproteobacteria bacterium]|jgi:putative addiction module component (TIGR02574 family)